MSLKSLNTRESNSSSVSQNSSLLLRYQTVCHFVHAIPRQTHTLSHLHQLHSFTPSSNIALRLVFRLQTSSTRHVTVPKLTLHYCVFLFKSTGFCGKLQSQVIERCWAMYWICKVRLYERMGIVASGLVLPEGSSLLETKTCNKANKSQISHSG